MEYALITGASVGIGKQIAIELASRKYNLVLVARNKTAMEDLAADLKIKYNTQSKVIQADLSIPKEVEKIHKTCQKDGIYPLILVNNAGFGNGGRFAQSDIEKEMALIQVNIAALSYLTRVFLPHMVAQKKGYILNVGSVAGFIPGPFLATYYASKAYVLSFSEALKEELKDLGVSVSVLCPGPTSTEFFTNAKVNNSELASGKLMSMMTASDVAKIGVNGMFAKKTIIITGFLNKFMPFIARISPRFIVRKVSAGFNQGRT